jgi:hypothetical protein
MKFNVDKSENDDFGRVRLVYISIKYVLTFAMIGFR